jgi:hypothetical protein
MTHIHIHTYTCISVDNISSCTYIRGLVNNEIHDNWYTTNIGETTVYCGTLRLFNVVTYTNYSAKPQHIALFKQCLPMNRAAMLAHGDCVTRN